MMGVKEVLKPIEDVFDETLDTAVAPSLGKVYSYISGEYVPETQSDKLMLELYGDANKFFSVTYITEGIERVFNEVLNALEKGSKGPIILPSLFGGGKTHTLLALLHAFRNPDSILNSEPREVANNLYKRIKGVVEKSIELIVIDGDYEKYAPSPVKPLHVDTYNISSIWGYIAHKLNRYNIIKDYDSNFNTPSKDSIEEIFKDKYAIILADEILTGYVLNLNDEQRVRFLEFFKRLAGAIQGKRIAIILTIPVRYQGEKKFLEVEEQYKIIEDFIKGVFEVLREQAIIIPPVRLEVLGVVNEVIRILRKRIFGSANIRIPEDILTYYQGVYNLDIFPASAKEVDLLRESYPFHPTYIDTLLIHISERRPTLFQRTRFAIQLTRKVIRSLWKSDRNPDFIHVWNIDLENSDISETIIGKLRELEKDYEVYLKKLYEVVNRSFERPLAKDIITSIFLRTFLYEGIAEALKAYPMESELYWMVYDREYNIEPARMQKVLETLLENPDVSYIARYDEGKVYFTTLVNITEILKKRKEEALIRKLSKIYEKLKEELGDILVAKDEEHEPFSKDMVIFLTSEDINAGYKPEESSYHRVIIYLGNLKEEQATDLILGYKDYRNTTVVLDIKDKEDLKKLLDITSWLYVIDDFTKNKELEEIYKDKDIKKLNAIKLNAVKESKRRDFNKNAPSIFRRVWYADGDKVVYIETTPKKSLLGNVYAALRSKGVEKLLNADEIDLEVFIEKLKETGFDIEKDWKQVSTLSDMFLRNPRLWMADKNSIQRVLERLYEDLQIAIMHEGKIYWKNICETEEQCDGGPHREFKGFSDTDLVAHSRFAFTKFIEQLFKAEGEDKKPDKIVRKYYQILTDEGPRTLRDLYNVYKESIERLYDILTNKKIKLIFKKEIIEKGFDLKIEPEYVEIRPNLDLQVKVHIEPIGGFDGEVTITVDEGSIKPDKGKPPFEAIWALKSKPFEDIYTYKVKAIYNELSRERTLTIKVLGEYEVVSVDFYDYKPLVGDIIEEISQITSIGGLQTISERVGKLVKASLNVHMDASGYDGKLKMVIDGIALDDIKDLIDKMVEVLKNLSLNAKLVFQNATPLNEDGVKQLNAIKIFLSGIKVKVRRKRT